MYLKKHLLVMKEKRKGIRRERWRTGEYRIEEILSPLDSGVGKGAEHRFVRELAQLIF